MLDRTGSDTNEKKERNNVNFDHNFAFTKLWISHRVVMLLSRPQNDQRQ